MRISCALAIAQSPASESGFSGGGGGGGSL